MNKCRHRPLFNAVRGLRMVVAECTRTMGKATTGAAMLLTSLPLQAQISADPAAPGTLRPTVLGAANGVPLVN
ncbi:MAG: ESPR-type extended signal peptide-containing protein, partial [Hydrogenophaga sp.]|uniref:ESPR-type extended signal peptide-containing protein n=1 Tax=Hydrogenophaga sp. TaxID=1904254 RepID=UPI0026039739